MNLLKCTNGHYYDGDKFSSCPHCDAGVGEGNVGNRNDFTMSVDDMLDQLPTTEPITMNSDYIEDTEPITNYGGKAIVDSGEKTVGFFNTPKGKDPVVGWLVCVEGADAGKSYTLKAGRNFIGRHISNDIVISGDASVSREKHAIVIYDPKSRNFLTQPGMSSELCYLNDQVVLQAEDIKRGDFLSLGKTKLMFVPLCGETFTWEDYGFGEK